jgi:OOP family OmpA-OmpF porin
MKRFKLIILFIFAFEVVFSQGNLNNLKTKDSLVVKGNYNEWIFNIGAGAINGEIHVPNGINQFGDNRSQLFNDSKLNSFTIGAAYNFSPLFGLKMDVNFDKFNNNLNANSIPYEVYVNRTSLQGVFNINIISKPKNENSRLNLLIHGGINLAGVKPIAVNDLSNLGNGTTIIGSVYGLTPTVRIMKKTYAYIDFSYFINNYNKVLNQDNLNSKGSSISSVGLMYSIMAGLSFTLDKNQ